MDSAFEVGKKLVALVKQGKNLEAINTLYADDIVSVEPQPMGNEPAEKKGIATIRGKNEWWTANHEIHSATVNGPWPHGDQFIAYYKYDVTPKAGPHKGHRFTMEESALYTVKNGKVAKEEFFYSMGG